MNKVQRADFVRKQLNDLGSLLEQWERYQVTARDPGEKEHSRSEINRIRQLIRDYEAELQGGTKVDENLQQPLIAPEIRLKRNNRNWIIGIIIGLLLLGAGAYFLLKPAEVEPDYSQYLGYLQQGDSLVKATRYTEAHKSYKKALSYNPGDTAAIKKITYLKKADELIAQKKFNEATEMFKVVVQILPSPGLSSEALAKVKQKKSGGSTNGELQFTVESKNGILLITVYGGVPFQGSENMPYEIDGINCTGCVEWTPLYKGYLGKIQRDKLSGLSISVRDSKGSTKAMQLPLEPTEQPQDAVQRTVANNDNSEESFNALVENGDKNFADNKFSEALTDYQSALLIKANDKALLQKAEACRSKIREEQMNTAKNIPKISIAGGTFTMGNENGFPVDRPEHPVTVSSFSLGKTEVTVAQYRAYCAVANKAMPPAPSTGWADENPITNITWQEAKDYCEWVGGRLPTEAEWEYAAKEGTNSGKNYSGSDNPSKVAVFKDNSGNRPSAVGRKQANALGLYDMTGNVYEWCSDWFSPRYYSISEKVNPKGPGSGAEKVIRGGAYNSSISSAQDGNQLRVTYRNQREPSSRENYIGFRVAWDK